MKSFVFFSIIAFFTLRTTAEMLTIDVPTGTTNIYTDVIGAVEGVRKTGGGTLELPNANPDFTGPFEIAEGFVTVKKINAIGQNNTLTIQNGAALRINIPDLKQFSHPFTTTEVIVGGHGPDGLGAIRYCPPSYIATDETFSTIRLTDDTTFLIKNGRMGSTEANGTFDLGGHTLTINGNAFIPSAGTFINPGKIINHVYEFILQNNPHFSDTNEASLTFAEGCNNLSFWRFIGKSDWALNITTNITIQSGAGFSETGSFNTWNGPVNLSRDALLTFSSYANKYKTSLQFNGKISGNGRVLTNNEWLEAFLTHPENDWDGGTRVQSGTLWAMRDGSLPAKGTNFVQWGKSLNLWMGKNGWTPAKIDPLLHSFDFSNGWGPSLYTPAGFTATYDQPITNAHRIIHNGPGTLVLTQPLTGLPNLNNRNGILQISCDGEHNINHFQLSGGTLLFQDAGDIQMENRSVTLINSTAETPLPKMIVAGKTVLRCTIPAFSTGSPFITVGYNTNERGIFELQDGACVTNRIQLGGWEAIGAFYQRGGIYHSLSGPGSDGVWGQTGYGFYELSGGIAEIKGWLGLGTSTYGTGIASITNGSFTVLSDTFCIGRGGYGAVYQTGGSFLSKKPIKLGELRWGSKAPGGFSVYTMDGTNAVATINQFTEMGERTNAVALVNLNAGIYSTPYFTKNALSENSRAAINWNGGTLKAMSNGDLFRDIDDVILYEKGAVIDTAGYAVSFGHPLRGPSGKSIRAITLPDTIAKTNWYGPAEIVFSGDNGFGASALTDFDSQKNTISKVLVTSHGIDYDDTLVATMKDATRTANLTCTVTLASIPSGGLMKIGEGSLTLLTTNTYAGTTTISNGSLILGAEGALPENAPLSIHEKGILDLAGQSLTTTNLLLTGTVEGDLLIDGTFRAESSDLLQSVAGTVNGSLRFSDSAVCTISRPEMLDASGRSYLLCQAENGIEGMPTLDTTGFPNATRWQLTKSDDCKILRLSNVQGTRFIIR